MKTRDLGNSLSVLALTALLFVGCGSKETSVENIPSPAAPGNAPEAVSIGDTAPPVAPPPSVANATAAPSATAAIATTQEERPVNDQGQVMSDLEYLNYLVHEVNESRITDVGVPQKAFKTEEEQMAYEEAMAKRMGPVKDLNELVTAGAIRALPEAPAGQHYTLDPTTGKVVLH